MFQLLTFGGLLVEPGEGAPGDLRLRPKALALLAMLAAAGERGCSRERLIGLFWPDVDEEHGRHSLRQLLYAIRSETGHDLVRAESSLFLDPRHIESDLAAFHAATKVGDWARAAALYRGPFLDGFYLSGAPEFERWVEQERARLAGAGEAALNALAIDGTARGDHESAARWWHRLTLLDPLSGRYAMGYVRALAAAGDRPKALAFLREHETVVRRELESEPDPEIRKLEAELRAESANRPSGRLRAVREVLTPSAAPAVSVPAAPGAAPPPPRLKRRLEVAAAIMLALAIVATLGMVLSRRGRVASTTSVIAARLYEEGVRAYAQRDMPLVQRLMGEALREDSTFAMAAYHLALVTQEHGAEYAARQRARRLARNAPEAERLMITSEMLQQELDPAALATTREWARKFPRDPRAFRSLGKALAADGDWAASAAATERAIELELEAEGSLTDRQSEICRVCDDFGQLAEMYLWWDSLPATKRTALRSLEYRPGQTFPLLHLAVAAARAGDSADAMRYLNRLLASTRFRVSKDHEIRVHLLLEDYDWVEREARGMLVSPRVDEVGIARWLLPIALRNQGRLAEAERLLQTGEMHGGSPPLVPNEAVDYLNMALIALESGNPSRAATYFAIPAAISTPGVPQTSGQHARRVAWHTTLTATALAAAGDTAAVSRLADTVRYWGERSAFGRDRRLQRFLHGLLLARAGNDSAAVEAYRSAIHSWSLGYTRINYELGKSLLRLGRPDEAIAAVTPALRGEVDAANLYVTRTELHELLAEAYRRAGKADSAAIHDRAVVRAWARADPRFAARREAARLRLAGLGR